MPSIIAQWGHFKHTLAFPFTSGQLRDSSGSPFSIRSIFSFGFPFPSLSAAMSALMPPPIIATSYFDMLLFIRYPFVLLF
jgi:hypothetical protein